MKANKSDRSWQFRSSSPEISPERIDALIDWHHQNVKPVAWDVFDPAHPDEPTTDVEGNSEFPSRATAVVRPIEMSNWSTFWGFVFTPRHPDREQTAFDPTLFHIQRGTATIRGIIHFI
jgi:hypothetical protein